MITDRNDPKGTVEDTGEGMMVNCWTNILNQVQGNGVHCGSGGDALERSKDIYPGGKQMVNTPGRCPGRNVWKFSFDFIYFFIRKKTQP